ncbi:MAG: DUF327 family protein [Synergistaceae bacterium]|jgi:uncharacterized protein YaaR (DUF327 family)|nr:DUF327 family protein [Synergistaceae bacterium]
MKVAGSTKTKTKEAAPYAPQSRGRGEAQVSGAEGARVSFAEMESDIEARMIIEELDDIGGRLCKYPTSVLLAQYRELVRRALDRIKRGMRIKREFKWRRTERSMFMTIERIEGALAELEDLEAALLRERDRTRVFSLMDEIKGCLISILF